MSVTFVTTVLQAPGMKATGLPIPTEVIEELGSSNKPAVTVAIGDYSYRSTVASRYGGFIVSLSAEHRGKLGLAAGDEVTVTLALDTAERTVVVPDDLAEVLDSAPGRRSAFDSLAPSRRAAIVAGIEAAKTSETRARRVDAALSALDAAESR
jgi:hypothetical protein